MSFEREIDAFRAYAGSFQRATILLIDTYDTLAAARNAATVGKEMAGRGAQLVGVRIDSGDLPAQARAVRQILDDAGLQQVKILGSGGLDEYDLADFSAAQAPFDSFGVGTKMGTSADAPWTDMSYKMVEYAGRPVQKLSSEKISWPGKKQAFRRLDDRQRLLGDILGLRGETFANSEPLLEKVMENGRALKSPTLATSREKFLEEFHRLVITFEAGLSFLGLGVPPPTPSWGAILSEGFNFIRNSPWPITWAGLTLMLTTLGFTLFGETLRDVLDPRFSGLWRA